jgi:hypothetical protein
MFSLQEKKEFLPDPGLGGGTQVGQKGNIAQLVEHCLCKAGAVGSNPTISTLLFELLVLLPAMRRRRNMRKFKKEVIFLLFYF